MWYPVPVEPRFGAPKGQPVARGRSLTEFQKEFPDEASCAAFLFNRRWPSGFVCPSCGGNRAAALKSRAYTFECYGCRRQTSITAGTAMHRTRLPLTAWFWAGHLMATHSNGMSARQLEDQLGLTYRTAWLLAQKLRRSMVDPDRELLEGVVEVDTRSGRVRLAVIADNTAASIEAFVRANVKPGATLLTDGHASYPGLTDYRHDPRIVGKMAAHIVLPWIYRVFALVKRWGLGTYHGLRRKHADTYLNEFVFRYNRRFYRHASFETVLGLTAHHAPASYWDIIGRANPRKGTATPRRAPRRRKTATGMRQDSIGGAENGGQNQAATVPTTPNVDKPGTTQ